jgi:hypothetical protein
MLGMKNWMDRHTMQVGRPGKLSAMTVLIPPRMAIPVARSVLRDKIYMLKSKYVFKRKERDAVPDASQCGLIEVSRESNRA